MAWIKWLPIGTIILHAITCEPKIPHMQIHRRGNFLSQIVWVPFEVLTFNIFYPLHVLRYLVHTLFCLFIMIRIHQSVFGCCIPLAVFTDTFIHKKLSSLAEISAWGFAVDWIGTCRVLIGPGKNL
jgi:hypothetical protein